MSRDYKNYKNGMLGAIGSSIERECWDLHRSALSLEYMLGIQNIHVSYKSSVPTASKTRGQSHPDLASNISRHCTAQEVPLCSGWQTLRITYHVLAL